MAAETCMHIREIKEIKTATEFVCEDCVRNGSNWVHLRTCQTCGVTLCCDDSPNKHMTKHFYRAGHPVIISAEPGEQWMWCYKDEVFTEY